MARTLRAESDFVQILMLTPRSRPEGVLAGFESGADDYLANPFDLAVPVARVGGLLRRRQWLSGPVLTSPAAPGTPPAAADVLEFAGHRLDLRALELHANDRAYRLTVMEADCLWGCPEDNSQACRIFFLGRTCTALCHFTEAPRFMAAC